MSEKKEETNPALRVGVGLLLHMIAIYSRIFLWRNSSALERHELFGNLKGLYPLCLKDEDGRRYSERYLYLGTDICVARSKGENKYKIVTHKGEITLSEFIEEGYSDKTVQPFLFNINMFK